MDFPDAKNRLFRPGYEKYSTIRYDSVNSITSKNININLLNPEQDSNHPQVREIILIVV